MDTHKIVGKVLGKIYCRSCGYAFTPPRGVIRNMARCPQCNQRSEFA